MTVATSIGHNLRIKSRQRALNDSEIATWMSLRAIEGFPDGGAEQVESSPLSQMHAYGVARELFRTRLSGWKVRPTVCAWIAFHSKDRLSVVTMWGALVASVANDVYAALPRESNPKNYGPAALRHVVTLEAMALHMNHMIPTDEQFELVWTSTKLGDGKYELDLERSWR